MSNHISHNDPKQPCQCATPAVSKHNITPKDLEHGGCNCHPQDLKPSRLDQVIAQYEAMTKEAEAARDKFMQEALAFDLQECSKKQVEQIFDGLMWDEDWMWCPSLDFDADGYAQLNVVVDDNGWAHFVDE